MPKKLEHPTEKVTVRLFAGDKETLDDFYPDLGYNAIVRQLVRGFIKGVKAKHNKAAGTAATAPNDFNIDERELHE